MRAILTDMKSGEVGTFEVPAPELRAGGVLVRTAFSAISAGTERNTIATGKKSMLGKALARPDLVKQVLDFTRANGARAAYQKVKNRLDTLSSSGYSCSGTILSVGDGVTEFQPGDRVACAGVGYASHSEISFVPQNLVAKVPASVPLEAACLTTIGAIAMHGLRQANVSFGETAVVIGAGLVGVLTIQLARAAGCQVIAIDASPSRAERAVEFGASLGLVASDPSVLSKIVAFTKYGADLAIISASSSSAEPLELGAAALRDRGRIVVLGSVPLGVSRETMYRKELSLTLSRSYGPGRYDPNYEELGNDYPIGYVRWTERRNMEAFLEFLASGSVQPDALLKLRYKVDQGAEAFAELDRSGAYTAVIEYDSSGPAIAIHRPVGSEQRVYSGDLRVGCIGAGSFARSITFPQLQALKGVRLEAVATASGASAFSAQKTFGFRSAQQPKELAASAETDAVFVLSHHDSHARYVVDALVQRKPVFVEKPLAISREELESICNTYQTELDEGRSPFLMVGFNRRFSPAADKIREFFDGRREPMIAHIRVNAGYLSRDHWTQRGGNGGRMVGEGCHFIDWARFIVGCRIERVYASALPDAAHYTRDNVVIVISFADGSIGNILYLANGDKSVPKESYEVFCEGKVARLDDYRTLELVSGGKSQQIRCNRDKGHNKEIELTISAIRAGQPPPIGFDELVEVTESCFSVIDSLSHGLPAKLQTYPRSQAIPDEIDGVVEVARD
jgi:polar amino acid transport system substrate-binding protein